MQAPQQVTPAQLRQALDRFSESELRDLCIDLRTIYGKLPGQEKPDKIDALVAQFERQWRIPELVVAVKQRHPDYLEPDISRPVPGIAPIPKDAPADRLLTVGAGRRRGCILGYAALALGLVAVFLITASLLRPRGLLGRQTSTPTTLPPEPTSMQAVVALSTASPTPSPTATDTPTLPATATATPVPYATPTATWTHTPTAAQPSPTTVLTPTATVTLTPTPTLPEPTVLPATAVLRVSPTPTSLPAPVPLEPETGAHFADRVRLKFSWYRRLQENEKISIYIQTTRQPPEFQWWMNEQEILYGGGAIHSSGNGYQFEINVNLKSVSVGEAFWRVSIVREEGGEKQQVSPWSPERRLYRTP